MGNQYNSGPDTGGTPSPAGMCSLARFTAELGKTPATIWRWRNLGWLVPVNIAGKLYLTSEEIARFKQRAAAGEFARRAVTPQRKASVL